MRASPVSEELHVDLKNVQIMFEVENLDFHVPRLCLKTVLSADIEDWSRQVSRSPPFIIHLLLLNV